MPWREAIHRILVFPQASSVHVLKYPLEMLGDVGASICRAEDKPLALQGTVLLHQDVW